MPFRGNTGAVSIGINNLSNTTNHTCTPNQSIDIVINNTKFVNNSAFAPGSKFRSTSHAFFNGVLTGRAGGMGIFIQEDKCNATIQVSNCTFEKNFARSYGGGLYFVYGNNTIQKQTAWTRPQFRGYITNCTFSNNGAGLGAGGFISSITSAGPRTNPHLVNITDSKFEGNYAGIGGGIYYYIVFEGGRGNRLRVRNTDFTSNRGMSASSTNNVGSAIAASIYYDFVSKLGFPTQEIENWYVKPVVYDVMMLVITIIQ